MSFLVPLYFAVSGHELELFTHYVTFFFFFFLFGLATQLVGSSFPDQRLNLDPCSKNTES